MTPPDSPPGGEFASQVPHESYGATLPEQLAQLADSPLLARFRASRRELAGDRWRPRYHFVSPESNLNDPNGLCRWQGQWHLFYQAYPPEDRRQHWGHAVSDDLIHWRDLPYAIYPDPEECSYSGSAWVEAERVVAMYHGTRVGNLVAVSQDPLLLNWSKLTGQAVIPLLQPDGSAPPYRVYDPCLWQSEGVYYSLSGGTLPGPAGHATRADFLFRSTDLVHWEYLHEFCEGDHFSLVGDDGACPYFWPVGDRHILLYFSHLSGGKYLLGDYDTARQKLVVTDGGNFTFGPWGPGGVHAPSATPDGDGGVIAIFNMNAGKPTPGWDQIMSLPRRLFLGPDGDLCQSPAGDYPSLRSHAVALGERVLPANEEVVLPEVTGRSLELQAEIDPEGAACLELTVLRSPGREEYTRIACYPQRGYHYRSRGGRPGRACVGLLDNTHTSTLPDVQSRPPEQGQYYLPEGEPLRLHIFVDHSSVEVFFNDRLCLALRTYPGRDDSLGVSLRAVGQPARLRSLRAWRLGSIYPEG